MVANTSAARSDTGRLVIRPRPSRRHATMAQAVTTLWPDIITIEADPSILTRAQPYNHLPMPPPPPPKLRQATNTFINKSGLLILGALIALVWANLERDRYIRFAHTLHYIVND